MDEATVFVNGRLTKDVKTFGEGETRRALFSVAVNRGKKDSQTTTFIDCIAWGWQADQCATLAKGKQIAFRGDLDTDVRKKEGVADVKTLRVTVRNVLGGVNAAPKAKRAEQADETADIPF